MRWQGGEVGGLEPWWTELSGRRREYTHSWSHKGLEPDRFKGTSTNFGIGGTEF